MPHSHSFSARRTNARAYLVVLAGICAALHIWKLPPALPDLQKELGFSLVQSGFLLSLVQLAGMMLGLAAGLVAERVGLRRCVLTGLGLLGVSSACGALFDSKGAMLVFRALEGCGFLMVSMPAPGLIRRHVEPSYLSRVLGVWGSYVPAGAVIILLGGSWFLSLFDWRLLWWLLAIVTAVMLGLVWRVIPRDEAQATHFGQKTAFSPWSIVKTTMSSENVWLVALSFAAYSCQWTTIIGFLPSIYVEAGISGTLAGVLTALAAGANVIGNLYAGRLLHHGVRPQILLCTGFAIMALGAWCAFGLDVPATYRFMAIVVFSATGGLIPATLFLLAIHLAPSEHTTSTTIGWMQQCSAIGQFTGPPVVAWVATLSGGWQWTWVVTGAGSVLGIVLAVRIGVLGRLALR